MRPRALLRGTGSNLIKVSTGRMYFVPEGQHVVARHEVPGSGVWTFGPRPKVLARNLVDAAEGNAGKPQLDFSKASAVECILSRRDSMIVARHEVPGKASLERTVP